MENVSLLQLHVKQLYGRPNAVPKFLCSAGRAVWVRMAGVMRYFIRSEERFRLEAAIDAVLPFLPNPEPACTSVQLVRALGE